MESLTFTSAKSALFQFNPHDTYLSTIQWLSELEFSKTEFRLLSKLLDKSFMRTHKKQEYNELLRLDKRVKLFLNYTLKDIEGKIREHERHLIVLDENVFSQDEVIYDEHKENENLLTEFRREMNRLKNELIDFLEIEWKAPVTREVAF